MLVEVLACVPIFLFLRWVLQSDPTPLYGVYSQPGRTYLLKKYVFRLLLWWRRRKHNADSKAAGYGVKSSQKVESMEQLQPLSADPHAIDSMYFNGLNTDGVCFVLRIARRHGRKAELWLSVRLPGIGFFQSSLHPDTAVYNTDPSSFSAAGLRFECLEPMRRWRVSYNGMLKKGLENEWNPDKKELVHVTFSFIWEAFTDFYDFDTDTDPNLLASAIAREKWTAEFWKRLRSTHQTHYEQYGQLHGVVKVQGHEPLDLSLRGVRDHSYGVRDWRSFHRYVVHFGILEDGSSFHVNTISLPKTLSYLKCGFMSRPNAVMEAVTDVRTELPLLGENLNPPNNYSTQFTAGGTEYHLEVAADDTAMYYHHDDWGNVIFEKITKFKANGVAGYGITEFCYRRPLGSCPLPPRQSLPLLCEPDHLLAAEKGALSLPFTAPGCASSQVVGGKGCQLAMLTQLDTEEFTVPRGFCLTITAFNLHMQKNPELSDKVTLTEKLSSGQETGSLQDACVATVAAFTDSELGGEIQRTLAAELIKQFGSDHSERLFAVRSSAAGEDSADMSAAGQMETILGVKGLQQIFRAVCRCWASHFAFPAVEYRRQHGQPIKSTMGVVVQEMVKADAAGVLFTRDPIDGNPSRMVLNANFGLGESVVSGEADPDSIVVHRTWDDHVAIQEKNIGQKKTKIIVQEGGGTETLSVADSDGQQCSVDDDVILRLAAIGIELEKRFADPRDIEWAVSGKHIYLLQARPITTLDQETETELLYEFDSAQGSDYELQTTSNIGEMMPGAMTPLTLSTFFKAIERAGQLMLERAGSVPKVHNLTKFTTIKANVAFINMHFVMGLYEGRIVGNDKRVAELSLMGETMDDFTLEEVERYNGRASLPRRIINACRNFANLNAAHNKLKKIDEKLKSYSIAKRIHKTALDLYQDLDRELWRLDECWAKSFHNSARSGSWSTILTAVVSQGKPDWTTQHFSDVAALLSKCDEVYSADVPSALQNLAATIDASGNTAEFVAMTPEDANAWLKNSDHEGSKQFKIFLQKHGHRCVREGEFMEKSWQSEPTKVVKVLQAMLHGGRLTAAPRHVMGVQEAIASVKSPLTTVGRLVLKWAVPKARQAVGAREWGKSVAVEMNEVFKQGYWKLAAMMFQEGRLPRPDLLFFLTHKEIGQLLRTRSGKLVSKAMRRKRVFPRQQEMKFPRVFRGPPQPIEKADEEDFVITDVKLTGMPVSQGVVKGIARVVTSLEGAAAIEADDILVVEYTDVGWSPYFPLISGLVTEIGGLLSHGAVVAREYGLPCVVNMRRATSLIKSGDRVILNGNLGTLEKVE